MQHFAFVADVLKSNWSLHHDEFRRRIGRAPTARDVIACPDRASDSKELREGIQFLIACKAPPQIVFAYEATGRLPVAVAMIGLNPTATGRFVGAIEQYFALRLTQIAAGDQVDDQAVA